MRQVKPIVEAVLVCGCLALSLTVCGSNNKAASNLGVTSGPADTHCVGQDPQEASICVCEGMPTADTNGVCTSYSNNATDTNTMPDMMNDYGVPMYGAEGDDDDCKYHAAWSLSSVAQNSPATFKVTATRLVEKTPLKGAATRAEVFLDATHPAPNTKPPQSVVEDPPGTYTISPVVFDASGKWTVRFHFFELCDDTQDASLHGHAAFFVTIP